MSVIFRGNIGQDAKQKYKNILTYLSNLENQFQFIDYPDGVKIIYLPPTIYWNIYKKMPGGQNFIKNYSFADENDKSIAYRFAFPSMYFDNTFSNLNGGNGIYGIYYGNMLIYIGYTKKGFINRFKEHEDAFIRKDKRLNDMYGKYNLDDIEFRILIDEEELQDMLGIDEPLDPEVFQLIEYCLIKTIRPIENIEGRVSPYVMKSRGSNFTVNKLSSAHLIKQWLTQGMAPGIGGNTYISIEDVWPDEEK